jgi:SAM-dependent methyltransferase
MPDRDWERVYRDKGDLGLPVLPLVRRAARLFRERGYRRVLDLACGTGRHSLYLARRGFEVYATDNAATAIEITKDKAARAGLTVTGAVHDMRDIPFGDGFFDALICVWSIHHGRLADIRRTVSEVYRVLRPGGTVVVDVPSVTTWDCGHGREIEPMTYIEVNEEERDVPHHYFTRQETLALFGCFHHISVRLIHRPSAQVEDDGLEHTSYLYNVVAEK